MAASSPRRIRMTETWVSGSGSERVEHTVTVTVDISGHILTDVGLGLAGMLIEQRRASLRKMFHIWITTGSFLRGCSALPLPWPGKLSAGTSARMSRCALRRKLFRFLMEFVPRRNCFR